jgi:acyl-CoA thioester hydrolase
MANGMNSTLNPAINPTPQLPTLSDPQTSFKTHYIVQASDIDVLGHVNNTVYLRYMENMALAHSTALGVTVDDYLRIGYAMVARDHHLTYLLPLLVDEEIELETWLEQRDALSTHRYYRIRRVADQKLAFAGYTRWVCMELATGRPRRMPEELRRAYGG